MSDYSNLIGQWVELVWNSPMPQLPEWLHTEEGELLGVEDEMVYLDREDGSTAPKQAFPMEAIVSINPKPKPTRMGPTEDEINDLMLKYLYESKEAEIAYHLRRIETLFDELYVESSRSQAALEFFKIINVNQPISSLNDLLIHRVFTREIVHRDDEDQ